MATQLPDPWKLTALRTKQVSARSPPQLPSALGPHSLGFFLSIPERKGSTGTSS